MHAVEDLTDVDALPCQLDARWLVITLPVFRREGIAPMRQDSRNVSVGRNMQVSYAETGAKRPSGGTCDESEEVDQPHGESDPVCPPPA